MRYKRTKITEGVPSLEPWKGVPLRDPRARPMIHRVYSLNGSVECTCGKRFATMQEWQTHRA